MLLQDASWIAGPYAQLDFAVSRSHSMQNEAFEKRTVSVARKGRPFLLIMLDETWGMENAHPPDKPSVKGNDYECTCLQEKGLHDIQTAAESAAGRYKK